MFSFNIHCPSIHQAKLLMKYLDKQGFKWVDGASLIECDNWNVCETDTCYHINQHTKKVEYHDIVHAKNFNEPVIEFETIAEQI